MGAVKNLKKGEQLFREGDPSECMYVIKTGSLSVIKNKGTGEIVLAELGPGDMIGEMAFFDNKPRSAGARAAAETTVIELPFKSLNQQFKNFPEWLKAIMRTVNNHLRNANQKIKNLERSSEEDTTVFPPHTISKLMAVLALVASRYGEKEENFLVVPAGTLRRFTIQIFQLPTNKMQKLLEILGTLGHVRVEELGEGRQKICVLNFEFLFKFVEFYNEFLFTEESKKIVIEEKELRPIRTLLHFAKKEKPNDKGRIKLNLTHIQAYSVSETGEAFNVPDVDSLIVIKLVSEKFSEDGGIISANIDAKELFELYPIWELIQTLLAIKLIK